MRIATSSPGEAFIERTLLLVTTAKPLLEVLIATALLDVSVDRQATGVSISSLAAARSAL
jgi:hypothetical protein